MENVDGVVSVQDICKIFSCDKTAAANRLYKYRLKLNKPARGIVLVSEFCQLFGITIADYEKICAGLRPIR